MKRLLAFLLAWCCALAYGQGVLPVPALSAHVIDQTGTLDAIQQKALEDKLMAFEQAKGSQLVVLMVASTQPEDIASYANRVANSWKIGRKEVGDGVLVVVAKDDRRVRIEVAKTLEGAIPDLAARRVIDDAIAPNFRKGDYAAGLQAAADQLIARINGEALPEASMPSARGGDGFDWFDLAIFLFFAVPIAGSIARSALGRKLGSFVTGAGVGTIAMIVTSSIAVAVVAGILALGFTLLSSGLGLAGGRRGGMGGVPWTGGGGGWSGGGGGSDGGGWGGSGGGGDFGGGGASGDW